MGVVTIGVVKESADGERRVAVSPDGVQRLRAAGHEVLVVGDCGAAAWFPDSEYEAAGAGVVSEQELYAPADAVLCVQPPAEPDRLLLRPDQVLGGMLQPMIDPQLAADLAVAKVTSISLDGLPRTVSRAGSPDALSSQANVAGYKAALVAADTYRNDLPVFMTATGTTRPAQAVVIGAGVAGLRMMDKANPQFSRTDVVLVVGANDVTNPAARRPGNSVSGMPILNVDEARSVIVIKRSMGHGYAGIDNDLCTARRPRCCSVTRRSR